MRERFATHERLAREGVYGIVLAAGASRRFGSPKALAVLDGRTLLASTLGYLASGGCEATCVVVAEPHQAAILSAHPGLWYERSCHPELGMLESARVGLRAVAARGAEVIVLALLDQPRVRPDTVAKLVDALLERRAHAAIPNFAGKCGHPIAIRVETLTELASTASTLRDVVRGAGALEVDVDDSGVRDDIDEPDALAQLALRS